MKRDMDIVRTIVLETEKLPPGADLGAIDGIDADTFAAHVIWLKEAGLVDAVTQTYLGGSGRAFASVQRLTWQGCEFADAIRSETLWKKAQENVMRPAMSFTFDVLRDWLKAEITQGLPTLRALGQ